MLAQADEGVGTLTGYVVVLVRANCRSRAGLVEGAHLCTPTLHKIHELCLLLLLKYLLASWSLLFTHKFAELMEERCRKPSKNLHFLQDCSDTALSLEYLIMEDLIEDLLGKLANECILIDHQLILPT